MSARALGWLVVVLTSGAVLANAAFGAPTIWSAAAIVFTLLYHAVVFGAKLVRRREGIGPFLLGLACLLAAQSVFQVLFYYLGLRLGAWTDALSLTLTLVTFQLVLPVSDEAAATADDTRYSILDTRNLWLAAALIPALIAFGYVLRGAVTQATDVSIRTPWPLLPPGTLLALAIIPLCAWLAAWKSNRRWVTAVIVSLALVSVAVIAPLLYRLGYGFDGFLHVATERIVFDTGTLEPKPLYYMGQYVFVTWLARLAALPIEAADRFLVPVAIAFLPLFFLYGRRAATRWEDAALLLFLPLAPFVATTPQSFAYVLGFGAVVISLNGKTHPAAGLSLAAWSLAVHPLAGLPLAGATLALQWTDMRGSRALRSPITWLLALAAAAAVPFAFLVISRGASTGIEWDASRIFDVRTWVGSFTALVPPRNRVALWPDWTALVLFLAPVVAITTAIMAVLRDAESRSRWIALIAIGAGTTFGGFVMRAAGEFAFLIDYERGNYADRLFLVGFLLLVPPAAAGAARWLAKLETAPALPVAALLLGLAAWHGAQAHAALPRHDAAAASYGWSVGRGDVEAVRWIDSDSQGATYAVLANQSVSAAAVREFGFKRYHDDVFYYPIPTGGALYQHFLEAVGREQTLEPIREAALLTASDIIYVVVNEYWWDAKRVAEELSALADKETTTSDGRVRVFRFDVK
ncbi:hypothetical protein EDM68_02260 [Candidatus Uhrbacteria bacterium]|nr:MAG: hypothetical protein EDM68_02260 [Candidatus Uhrbacteria bacterium]